MVTNGLKFHCFCWCRSERMEDGLEAFLGSVDTGAACMASIKLTRQSAHEKAPREENEDSKRYTHARSMCPACTYGLLRERKLVHPVAPLFSQANNTTAYTHRVLQKLPAADTRKGEHSLPPLLCPLSLPPLSLCEYSNRILLVRVADSMLWSDHYTSNLA